MTPRTEVWSLSFTVCARQPPNLVWTKLFVDFCHSSSVCVHRMSYFKCTEVYVKWTWIALVWLWVSGYVRCVFLSKQDDIWQGHESISRDKLNVAWKVLMKGVSCPSASLDLHLVAKDSSSPFCTVCIRKVCWVKPYHIMYFNHFIRTINFTGNRGVPIRWQ